MRGLDDYLTGRDGECQPIDRRPSRRVVHTCEDDTETPCSNAGDDEPIATVPLVHLDKGPFIFWYCEYHGERQLKRRDTWRASDEMAALDD